MARVLNETPFEHLCAKGTVFTAERCDFVGGVVAKIPASLSHVEMMRDVAQMIGYHAGNILSELNGFAGYDCVSFILEYEVSATSSMIPEGGWRGMKVEKFFSERRFQELGIKSNVIMRACNGVHNMCILDYSVRDDLKRRSPALSTVGEFLKEYKTRDSMRIPNIGTKSVDAIISAITSVGLPFPG